MKDSTLCLLIKDDKILLGMKKRGFGVGKWNGVGGKFDFSKDKDILGAAIRETKEEIGVSPNSLNKVAFLRFHFPNKEEWSQNVHVFLIDKWDGDPEESEEMRPQWFEVKEIPYASMWDDDKFWLPHILAGKKIDADFVFGDGEKIASHNINFVSGF